MDCTFNRYIRSYSDSVSELRQIVGGFLQFIRVGTFSNDFFFGIKVFGSIILGSNPHQDKLRKYFGH